MERTKPDTLPAEIEAVRERIEEWRRTRAKRTRMPEELWEAAVALAGKHGAWRISRALRVRYEGLKSRAMLLATVPTLPSAPGFVDMTSVLGAASSNDSSTTVDLSRADGTRLLLRLPSGAVDVQSIIRAFSQPIR
jgi:hypothetical protein